MRPVGVLAREGDGAVVGGGEVEGGALDPALPAAVEPATHGDGVDAGAGDADMAGLALGAVHGRVVPGDGRGAANEFDAGWQLPLQLEGDAGSMRGQRSGKAGLIGAGGGALQDDIDLLAAVVVGVGSAQREEGEAGGQQAEAGEQARGRCSAARCR